MCGIAGIFAMDGHLDPALSAALPAMTHAIRHRGPDGDGFFNDGRAGLGHRRLAIIDIARGAQPIANEDGSCWVMFNGEIYNHTSVRKTLEARGHVFRTFSDTEVIVHAYEEYGPSCVESLEGMFALVVYDQRERTLFIARDRLGKKPLFYATFGGAFHFASEIKALKASPFWNGEIDLSSLEGYLSLGYFLAPDTAYRHVRKLEPGHWLRVRNGHVEIRKYWDVEQFDDDQRPEEDLLEELTARLRQCSPGSARERGAVGRLPLRRHRFGPGGLVHVRVVGRQSPDELGRVRRSRTQRAACRGVDRRLLQYPASRGHHRATARTGARSDS